MEKIVSFFTTLSLIFTYIFGLGSISTSEGYELKSKTKLSSINSLCSAQGLCCDGEYFYTSGALTAINFTGLAKYDLNMKLVKKETGSVPKEFTENCGSNHIGGIDCANGYIYAPAEGKIDGEYKYDLILLYDCENLEYTGKYYDISSEHLTDGIPWLAIDRENGWLYTSKFANVTEILKYDLETMTLIECIQLKETVTRIQGGSVYNGILYLSYDVANSTEEQILKIDPETGDVALELTRYLPNYDNEAEDICYYPMADGTILHTLDYDKLLNANVMHYAYTK